MRYNYIPRNNLVMVEKTKVEEVNHSGIIMAESSRGDVFIELKVLAIGSAITSQDLKVGDVVLAEDMFQPFNKNERDIGLIDQKFIHCIKT
jgi:co-chaperonin GroES (HSP10)